MERHDGHFGRTRISMRWREVVPEPSSTLLLGFGWRRGDVSGAELRRSSTSPEDHLLGYREVAKATGNLGESEIACDNERLAVRLKGGDEQTLGRLFGAVA